MSDIDDDAIATALNLEHAVDLDLLDPKTSLILSQLAMARKTAIEAVRALIEADPHDAKQIMSLQNDVGRFSSLVEWLIASRTKAREAFLALPPDEQQAVWAFTHPHSEINDA
jgi:hypothetical protein